MKTIFSEETQIGVCNAELGEDGTYSHPLAIPWDIWVQTTAETNIATLSLVINHRCLLKMQTYNLDQPWIRAHRLSHSMFSSEKEMAEWARDLHLQFINKAVNVCPPQFILKTVKAAGLLGEKRLADFFRLQSIKMAFSGSAG